MITLPEVMPSWIEKQSLVNVVLQILFCGQSAIYNACGNTNYRIRIVLGVILEIEFCHGGIKSLLLIKAYSRGNVLDKKDSQAKVAVRRTFESQSCIVIIYTSRRLSFTMTTNKGLWGKHWPF